MSEVKGFHLILKNLTVRFIGYILDLREIGGFSLVETLEYQRLEAVLKSPTLHLNWTGYLK